MGNDIIIRRLSIAIIFLSLFVLAVFLINKSLNNPKTPVGIPDEVIVTDQNPTKNPLIDKLTIANGFAMQIFASNLKDARVIIFDSKNRMLVSQTSEGRISILEDENKDGIADKNKTLVSGLSKPHGLALNCQDEACLLYVAQHSKLISYDYDLENGTVSNEKKLISIPATATDRHSTRTLLLLPDNKTLLISVGSSCNVCNENDAMRGRIMAYNTVSGAVSEYARGLRNSVFMTLSPSGKIFATEMGRDGLGDNTPPDEINIIEPSKNYGWPICYGANTHDSSFDKNTYIRNPCTLPFEVPAFIEIDAHSAPLGLAFVPENSWPEDYQKDLLVAYHGSWNRSIPTGYKIVRNRFDDLDNFIGTQDFITGWLTITGEKLGRPVDLVFASDGALYISDDQNGSIYRVVKN